MRLIYNESKETRKPKHAMATSELILVQTSFAQRAQAEKMAAELVEQGLAACAQVSGPVFSAYRWRGRLQREEEHLLTAKTVSGHYQKLSAFIGERHPYEVPEIIAVPILEVNDAYLDWAKQQCA